MLRPGGRFVVVDGWRTEAFDGLPAVVREATVAVERAMAVAAGQSLDAVEARGRGTAGCASARSST